MTARAKIAPGQMLLIDPEGLEIVRLSESTAQSIKSLRNKSDAFLALGCESIAKQYERLLDTEFETLFALECAWQLEELAGLV